ncbi:MAG: hypothetical protein NW237_01365 [Cyanobacteriota bacterium]|nr:hypothetical protein [Cyanobacteriota bacterium]
MLYLAKVQRKGLFGQAELQLLAHRTHDQVWIPSKTQESVSSSEASGYNVGVLLLLELSDDRHILHIEEASQKLVEILHTLSQASERMLDMSEIERWRQSLTRQSQELSRREAEVEARQEQLQEWESNLRKRQSI